MSEDLVNAHSSVMATSNAERVYYSRTKIGGQAQDSTLPNQLDSPDWIPKAAMASLDPPRFPVREALH